MNELDDLRHALHAPPDFAPRALDLDAIVARGGRLRARRRGAASAAAALTVVAVLVGGGVWVNHDRAAGPAPIAPADPGPAAQPRPTDGATAQPDPAPTSFQQDDQPLGTIVKTGMSSGGRAYVLYAVPVNLAGLPKVHFGVMLGLQATGSAPEAKVVINETTGSDRSPGFHTGEAAMNIDGADTPAFGYFVGPAARITASVHGKLLSAHLAAWSEDPQVIFYWFDLKDFAPGAPAADLTALDRTGRKLATTKSGLGVG
jgi:hypothetical protein